MHAFVEGEIKERLLRFARQMQRYGATKLGPYAGNSRLRL